MMIFSYSIFIIDLTGEASLKDGITYQQMQVSFSYVCANLFQMFNVCKPQEVFFAHFILLQVQTFFFSSFKKENITFFWFPLPDSTGRSSGHRFSA